jgi:CHASE3 domain sensor protein
MQRVERGASDGKPSQFSSKIWRTVGCAVALAIVFALYALAEKKIHRADQLRDGSRKLADELRQSSDDLTRMARTYVVTADPIYKQHYQTILEIRDGIRAKVHASSLMAWSRNTSASARGWPRMARD